MEITLAIMEFQTSRGSKLNILLFTLVATVFLDTLNDMFISFGFATVFVVRNDDKQKTIYT